MPVPGVPVIKMFGLARGMCWTESRVVERVSFGIPQRVCFCGVKRLNTICGPPDTLQHIERTRFRGRTVSRGRARKPSAAKAVADRAMEKKGINWDEANLKQNDEESLAANRTKILEPKTPYHELADDGETPMPFPPKAPAARAGGHVHSPVAGEQLTPGMDFSKLAAAAEGRRTDEAPLGEDEKDAAFRQARKDHYKIGSLAELRRKAAEMDEDEDEEDSAR